MLLFCLLCSCYVFCAHVMSFVLMFCLLCSCFVFCAHVLSFMLLFCLLCSCFLLGYHVLSLVLMLCHWLSCFVSCAHVMSLVITFCLLCSCFFFFPTPCAIRCKWFPDITSLMLKILIPNTSSPDNAEKKILNRFFTNLLKYLIKIFLALLYYY